MKITILSSKSPLYASGAARDAARYRQSSLYFPQLDGEKPDLNGYNQLDHNSLEQPAAQGSNVVNKGAGLLSYSHLNSLNLNPILPSKTPLQGEPAMWKTPRGNSFPEALSCHLCPDCDSLGPHVIMSDDLPGDAWLECIDCGAVLGSVVPQGIPTHVEPEPMDGEEVLGARTHPVPASGTHPGRAANVNLIVALLGWTRKI